MSTKRNWRVVFRLIKGRGPDMEIVIDAPHSQAAITDGRAILGLYEGWRVVSVSEAAA